MLLVRVVQSFIAGPWGNIDATRQYMNLWAIQRDAAMDGEDVSRLVATEFLEHANIDLGIVDYRHLAAYFGGDIKQSYCTEFFIYKTSGHSSTTAAREYANCSNDHRFMDSQQMYTYRLAAETWHRLLQLDRSPIRNPCLGSSTVEVLSVATLTWPSMGVKPNTWKSWDLESSGTPKCLELNSRTQNTLHWGVLGVIRKVLKRTYQKWPRIGHLDICRPSYGQMKGRESNWQFVSRPLKVRNRPLSEVQIGSVIRR